MLRKSYTFDDDGAAAQRRRPRPSSTSIMTTTSRTVMSWATPLFLFLLPSFAYPRHAKSFKKPHPTAYLDGLRGVAAFVVVLHHYVCQFTPVLLEGYGSQYTNYWFLQLPVVRIVHSGAFMVEIFFILSGFVLSVRGLQLARQGKQTAFMSAMTSSIFRRWIRLAVPVVASMFLAMMLSRAQVWHALPKNWITPGNVTHLANLTNATALKLGGSRPVDLQPISLQERSALLMHEYPNITAMRKALNWTEPFTWMNATIMAPRYNLTYQIFHVLNASASTVNPFGLGAWPEGSKPYNPGYILWTIPMEWLGSMVTFLTVIGLAWTTFQTRMSTMVALVAYAHWQGKSDVALFLSGIILADITLYQEAQAERDEGRGYGRLPQHDEPPTPATEKGAADGNSEQEETIFWGLIFLIGMFLGSKPMFRTKNSLGWIALWYWVPATWHLQGRLYTALGAFLVLLSITQCAALQRLFTTRPALYLGRISFSLYLTHVHLLWTMGTRVIPFFMWMVGGGTTQVAFTLAMVLGLAFMMPPTLWLADVFTRIVDEKAVGLAKWVGNQALTFPE